MEVTNEHILKSIRYTAWERAKGELNAILNTYWDNSPVGITDFDKAQEEIKAFIDKIEGEGIIE